MSEPTMPAGVICPAMAKRDRIIAREGDGNGQRLTDWYLAMLIQEEMRQEAAILEFNGGVPQVIPALEV